MRPKSAFIAILIVLALLTGSALWAQQAGATTQAPATQETKPADQTAAPAPAAHNETVTGTIDLGYRWLVRQNGSEQMYRTLVNYGEGPKLLGAHLTFQPRKLWDRLDVDTTSWGGEPYSAARLYMNRAGAYDLNFQYRTQNFFSNVADFANPLLTLGYPNSQNANDYDRHLYDFDFQLFPNHRIAPFFSWNRTSRKGPGFWPWPGPGNEYLVNAMFDDASDVFRGGTHLNFSRANFTVEVGGTKFFDDQTLSFTGTNPGNRRTPLFGTTMALETLTQGYRIDGDMMFARISGRVDPVSFVTISGQFAYSQPSADVRYTESATGRLVSPTVPRTFTGLSSTAVGEALRPRPSGNATIEIRPLRNFRIVDAYNTNRFHSATSLAFNQTLTNVTGLLGTTQPSTVQLATAGFGFFSIDYNRNQLDLIWDVHPRVTLRAGHRIEWSEAKIFDADEGDFERQPEQRNVILVGADFRAAQKLNLNAEAEVSSGKSTLFRTSLFDYNKMKVGGRFQAKPWLRISGKLARLENNNDNVGFSLGWRNWETGLGLAITPNSGKRLSVQADYMYQVYDSKVGIILPPFFQPGLSIYRQSAGYANAFVNVNLVRGAGLNFGGSALVSHGTRPTKYYQPRAELFVPLHEHVSWFGQWQYYDYALKPFAVGTQPTPYENFNAHLFSMGLRFIF